MKTLKAIFIMLWILAAAAAETAVPEKQETEWPKKIEKAEALISIYQPQINSMEGDMLDARAAISVKKPGEKMVFGAMWFTSKLETDFDTRLVSLIDMNIESVKFPAVEGEGEKDMEELLQNSIPEMDLTYSLDRLLTSLKMEEESNALAENLSHAPPKIYFEDEAAVLVLIDGDPILQDIEDTKIQYVVNTPYFILYNKADGFFYLRGGKWWYRAGRVENTWRQVASPPASITEIQLTDEDYETDVDSIARTLQYPPKVILSKEPAELIITDGEPDFATLEGTDLLYVRNTESEIIMDINSQDYYVLIAGRWYKSKSLDSEGWEFVSPDNLPEYFTNIATDSEMGSVRSSVPNTQEAKEAILENEIPQTAEVDRKSAKVVVSYDGNPQFERIKGTEMSYAVNTDKSVLLVDNRYYAVDNAIWFVSDQPTGPWEVCVSVPDDVQTIPPEYPVYNVKYVQVYDYTPDVVYVGYTPGYTYSYRYHGTIVYGTGYHYHPWYHTYYYPRPVTYGYGVHYNPYTGWGFSTGVSYGWIGYSYYRSPYYYTSWWGPAGYCYGYRHGYYTGFSRAYYRGYYYGYSYGVYTSSRSGYRAGYYDGYHHHSNGYNIYKSHPTGVIHTGTRASTTNYGSRSSRSGYSSPATVDRKNNVYTDRQGNVYRKKGDNWQTRQDGSWKKSDLPGRSTGTDQGSRTTTVNRTRTTTGQTSTGRTNQTQSTGTRTQTTGTQTQRTGIQTQGTDNRTRTTGTQTQRTNTQTQTSGTTRPVTGQDLNRDSRARTQGSQRTYIYQQSRSQPTRSTVTRSSSSRSTSAGSSGGSSTKSSATRSTGSTSRSKTESTGSKERKR